MASKLLKQKKRETQLRKEEIMKNVDELYEKYYNSCNSYKSHYDTDDELNWAKKKKFDYKEFELGNKKDKDSKLTVLPEWLSSRNDFNEAIKLIENIRADTNNVTSSSGDKKVFNDLNELINDIRIKKLHGKVSLKKYGALFLI